MINCGSQFDRCAVERIIAFNLQKVNRSEINVTDFHGFSVVGIWGYAGVDNIRRYKESVASVCGNYICAVLLAMKKHIQN